MNTQSKDPREVLDLTKPNNEFVLSSGIGRSIYYHGSQIDLGKIMRGKAEEIANDPAHPYLTFHPEVAQAKLLEAQKALAARTAQ